MPRSAIRSLNISQPGQIGELYIFIFWNTPFICIILPHHRGKFNPSACTVILREDIPLVGGAQQGIFRRLLHRKPLPPELELEIIFTEDKLLDIKLVQADGTVNRLDVRL